MKTRGLIVAWASFLTCLIAGAILLMYNKEAGTVLLSLSIIPFGFIVYGRKSMDYPVDSHSTYVIEEGSTFIERNPEFKRLPKRVTLAEASDSISTKRRPRDSTSSLTTNIYTTPTDIEYGKVDINIMKPISKPVYISSGPLKTKKYQAFYKVPTKSGETITIPMTLTHKQYKKTLKLMNDK